MRGKHRHERLENVTIGPGQRALLGVKRTDKGIGRIDESRRREKLNAVFLQRFGKAVAVRRTITHVKINRPILEKRRDPTAEFDIADEFIDTGIALANAYERRSARAEGMANPI